MLLLNLAIAIIVYSLGAAVVKASSSKESWLKSVISTIAFSRLKISDSIDADSLDELLSKSFWGPRDLTRSRIPVLGVLNIFKDIWGAGRFAQIVAILYAVYMSLFSMFGPWMSVVVTLALYLALMLTMHILYKYAVITTEPKHFRILANVGLIVVIIFMVIKFNSINYSKYRKDTNEIVNEYSRVRDSILARNDSLYQQLAKLNMQYEGYKAKTDSLLKVKSTTEQDYQEALDYLNDFIRRNN